MESFVIAKIDAQTDRILLYGHKKWPDDYYVICPANTKACVGDTVEYEPYGYNFGWLIRIISQSNKTQQ